MEKRSETIVVGEFTCDDCRETKSRSVLRVSYGRWRCDQCYENALAGRRIEFDTDPPPPPLSDQEPLFTVTAAELDRIEELTALGWREDVDPARILAIIDVIRGRGRA